MMRKHFSKLMAVMLAVGMIFTGCGSSADQSEKDAATISTSATEAASSETTVTDTERLAEAETETETETGCEYDIIPEEFAYSLTVSINPLVELYFDAADVGIGVAYLNEDAVDAYKDLELVGTSYDEGLELLVDTAVEKGYLKDEGNVKIELAKVGTQEKPEVEEKAPLVNASKAVTQAIVAINESPETEAPIAATVEIAVAEEVVEEVGISQVATCTACNGTGNDCKECNGVGIVNCKACNNGVETCGVCNGTARINCHGCHGSGQEKGCSNCGGSGTEPATGTACGICGGSGLSACKRCGGSGSMACDACHGAGSFTCSWCGGALRHVCPICWGEGVCSTCGGTGIQ